jgi:hypothetical protein
MNYSNTNCLNLEIGNKYFDFEKLRYHFYNSKSPKIFKVYIEYPKEFMINFTLSFKNWKQKISQLLPFRIHCNSFDNQVYIEFNNIRQTIDFLYKFQSSFYYKVCNITIISILIPI